MEEGKREGGRGEAEGCPGFAFEIYGHLRHGSHVSNDNNSALAPCFPRLLSHKIPQLFLGPQLGFPVIFKRTQGFSQQYRAMH